MQRNNKIISITLKLIGIALICIALYWTVNNILEDLYAGIKSNKVLEIITDGLEEQDVEIKDYIANPKMEMPIEEIEGNKYIGVITIERIGIKLPVLAEWDYNKLKISPARYEGSAYLNNLIIAAHAYRSHFRNIRDLEKGDKVKFEDVKGNIFEYEVILKETIKEEDKTKIKEGEWDLTLFTCASNNKFRIVIRLKNVEV